MEAYGFCRDLAGLGIGFHQSDLASLSARRHSRCGGRHQLDTFAAVFEQTSVSLASFPRFLKARILAGQQSYMDSKSVFITVMLVILANGAVLSAIHHDFPKTLRPAAKNWRWATLLVALGCTIFALDSVIPHALTVILANGCLFAGLTIYYLAIRQFHNLPISLGPWLPSIVGMTAFIYYAVIVPNTNMRILVISVIWVWLMSATIKVLLDKDHRDGSRSRMMLAFMYFAALMTTVARAAFYFYLQLGSGLNITDNTHWLNAATPVFLAVLPVIGTTAFILMCTDLVRRRWEHAASRDYLTDLPNRRTLTDIGLERMTEADQQQTACAVAILDIDEFKLINDTYGHGVGDRVLRHVASCLQSSILDDDFVARSGGEEFVVIFGKTSSMNAEASAERLREAIEATPYLSKSHLISVTVSIGLIPQLPKASTFDEVLSTADKALYFAKANGRNRIEVAP
ncbi:GGDEF domain-containing protein [Paraburkholderia aspalathi]|nr:GGDEF domain-containing protein [Paraburkholderia aspalathi]